jgi:hypothetical protein
MELTAEEKQREESQQRALDAGIAVILSLYSKSYNKIYLLLLQYLTYGKYDPMAMYALQRSLRDVYATLDSQGYLATSKAVSWNTGAINAIYDVEIDNTMMVAKLQGYLDSVNSNLRYTVNKAIISLQAKHQMLDTTMIPSLQQSLQKQLSKELLSKFLEDNISAIVDKSGRRWRVNTYIEMLSNVMLQETQVTAMKEAAIITGNTLARIPYHSQTVDACRSYQGEIICMVGTNPNYRSYAEIKATGDIWHIRCKHLPIPILLP